MKYFNMPMRIFRCLEPQQGYYLSPELPREYQIYSVRLGQSNPGLRKNPIVTDILVSVLQSK